MYESVTKFMPVGKWCAFLKKKQLYDQNPSYENHLYGNVIKLLTKSNNTSPTGLTDLNGMEYLHKINIFYTNRNVEASNH